MSSFVVVGGKQFEFTCPKCEGHDCAVTKVNRTCKGFITIVNPTEWDEEQEVRCNFKWTEKDDRLYLTPTGE